MPNIVFEILSPGRTNLNRDLTSKRRLYAKYGVEEYWIVDGDKQQVIIFNMLEGDLVETGTFTTGDVLTSQVLPGFSMTVESIFTDVV